MFISILLPMIYVRFKYGWHAEPSIIFTGPYAVTEALFFFVALLSAFIFSYIFVRATSSVYVVSGLMGVRNPTSGREHRTEGKLKTNTIELVEDQEQDPQQEKWGGRSKRNGRQLIASVIPEADQYHIKLAVTSTEFDKPLSGEVIFYLPPSLEPSTRVVQVIHGVATLALNTHRPFTVKAEADNQYTQLELDLVQLSNAPKKTFTQ